MSRQLRPKPFESSAFELARLRLPQMSRKVGSGRRAAGSKTINLGLMAHKDISILARIFGLSSLFD